jgi:hypothetical protein
VNTVKRTFFCFAVCRKKVVIHVPSSIKHIHHHHTNKVILKPELPHEHNLGGDSWIVSKGLDNLGGWTEEHVIGHNLGGSHQNDWYKNTGWQGAGHGPWRDGKVAEDVVLGSGNAGGFIKHETPHIGLAGRNPGGLKKERHIIFSGKAPGGQQTLKGQGGDLDWVVHGKFLSDGSGLRGSNHVRWQNLHGHEAGSVITGTIGSEGQYEVKEPSEGEKGLSGGAFVNSGKYGGAISGHWDKPVIGHSGGHPSVSSSEVKGQTGTSYSTFVLHDRPAKGKRHLPNTGKIWLVELQILNFA